MVVEVVENKDRMVLVEVLELAVENIKMSLVEEILGVIKVEMQ